MSDRWTASSVGLPNEGEPVEFVLDDRDTVLNGNYVQRTFRSRWTTYGVGRVCSWRSLSREHAVSAQRANPSDTAQMAGDAQCVA